MPPTFLNFAYGSNMAMRRLRERTASARPVGIGRLADHRLMWHKSGQDGSAKCDIHATPGSDDQVWGVLFEIALSEKPRLDVAEGLGRGYRQKTVDVLTADGVVQALAYYATDIDTGLLPYDWYLAFVLAGALEHGLPAAYVQELRLRAVIADPDLARRQQNQALLRGMG